jgi:hypothetical protein
MLKIVISGVNLVEGGILSVLQDTLKAFTKKIDSHKLEIIVLIHDKNLVENFIKISGITFLEFPNIKSSWIKRLNFEYAYCKKLALKLKPDFWFSLHDITPNIVCPFKVVYCHNPSPFYKLDSKYIFYDIKFTLFCLFYKYLYKLNITTNDFVILQQNWIRKEFNKLFKVNGIVAYPILNDQFNNSLLNPEPNFDIDFSKKCFIFPSIPRTFKNFEIICEAAKELENNGLSELFQIILTLNGNENKYARKIFQKYKNLKTVKFIGVQKREVIFFLYSKVDCLIFPSKLETWGLPISEFKHFNKTILLADLPYAIESIGDYEKVKFFNPLDHVQLSGLIKLEIENKLEYDLNKFSQPEFPFFKDWDSLIEFLIDNAFKRKNLLLK